MSSEPKIFLLPPFSPSLPVRPIRCMRVSMVFYYSDSSNLIGQFEVSNFHSDTDEGTTCTVKPVLNGHARATS